MRKKVNDSLSFAANYYVDMISSASVDVLSTASPYKETRRQGSMSADYLHGNTTYSGGYIESNEPRLQVQDRVLFRQPVHVRRSDHHLLRFTRAVR